MTDGLLSEIAREMLEESFRKDIIGVSIKGSVEDALSSAWLGTFKGLKREQSGVVRDVLQDAFINNRTKGEAVSAIVDLMGLPQEQAEVIVNTEFQQIRNRARYLAYLEDDADDSRYIWDTKRDGRVCPICEDIQSRTLPDGVPIKELLIKIKESQYSYGQDTARQYTAHPNDRCRIARLR